MLETILIVAFSLGLFAYWFRYTVLLLLTEEQEGHPTVISQLNVQKTRESLRNLEGNPPFDALQLALDADYRMIRYLLDHAAGMNLARVEHYLLISYYRVMKAKYHLTRRVSRRQARQALDAMASVLTCIAYKMGERSATFSQA